MSPALTSSVGFHYSLPRIVLLPAARVIFKHLTFKGPSSLRLLDYHSLACHSPILVHIFSPISFTFFPHCPDRSHSACRYANPSSPQPQDFCCCYSIYLKHCSCHALHTYLLLILRAWPTWSLSPHLYPHCRTMLVSFNARFTDYAFNSVNSLLSLLLPTPC